MAQNPVFNINSLRFTGAYFARLRVNGNLIRKNRKFRWVVHRQAAKGSKRRAVKVAGILSMPHAQGPSRKSRF